MQIFDSHVHFFDPSRPDGITWPEPASPLYRTCLPGQLRRSTEPHELLGCVAVETSRRPADDRWLLDLGKRDSTIRAVILNLQPDRPDFPARLAAVEREPLFAGIRLRPIADYELSGRLLGQNLALLQSHRKTVEFGAPLAGLKSHFARLAAAFPDTLWILDHCGHPADRRKPARAWIRAMSRIAALPNVMTKLTGVQGDEEERSLLNILLELFGAPRLLYGSNWPVSQAEDAADDPVSLICDVFGSAAADVLCGNVRRLYKI